MAERTKLSQQQISQGLQSLSGWALLNGKLHKEFTFADFVQAFRFMSGVALVAERMNHHPEWCNVYNRVVIDLSTHDVGGISTLDLEFASKVDAMGR